MSQLHTVLRRSVAHLDPSDHDGRARMFANAREAMIRLLWSYDPPLSPSEIDSKIDEFDDIVVLLLDETGAEAPPRDDEAPEYDASASSAAEDSEPNAADPETPEADDAEPRDSEPDDAAPDTDKPDVATPPTAPEVEPEASARPAPTPPAMSDRRAEALAILRRPARFEPLQIGTPTPVAADKAESALKAKKAVEEALARLNGRLAPIADDEPHDEATDAGAEDDAIELDDELAPRIAPDAEDETVPDAVDADEGATPEPESDMDDWRQEPDDHEPDDFEDRDPDDSQPADSDEAFDDEAGDEPRHEDDAPADEPDEALEDPFDDDARSRADIEDEDEPDERRLRSDPHELLPDSDRLADRRFVDEPDEDDPRGNEPYDDEPYDDEPARPGLGERLRDALDRLGGRMIAAIAAIVILLVGGLLGTAYFFARSPAPQVAVVEAEPPVTPPATSAPSAPAEAPAGAPAEPAAPASPQIPTGALALETLNLFDGRDPSVFQSSPDNPVRFEGDTLGGFARVSSSANSTGSRITVGRGVFERLAGRTIRLVVVARAAPSDPASSLRFAYQNGRSLSPWQGASLGPTYTPLSMTWTVPKERGGPETDAVLIEPGIPGDGTAADISSVRIEVLQ